MTAIGVNLTKTFTADELSTSGIGHAPGDRYMSYNGKEYLFAQANGAITGAGYVCSVDETYHAAMISTSNDGGGDLIGIPGAAVADNSYGWFQVKGPCDIQVLASAAANARLNTTATGGALDDDGTTGAYAIDGIALTTARSASAGTAPAILNYPQVATAAL